MSLGRIAFVVLGCAKNQVEAESMSSRLAQLGWEMTADIPNASVLVVHTCGFLEAARQEALQTIASLRKAAPRSFLVMSGCYAQYLNKSSVPGVDALVGTGELHTLPDIISKARGAGSEKPGARAAKSEGRRAVPFVSSPAGYHDAARPRPLRPGQLSAYLRISEGCNHRCTFCIIPQLRGNLKSRAPGDIYQEAGDLLDRGVRELVVISQDTTDYGRDLSPAVSLTDLLDPLLARRELTWLRLLYAYPSEVDGRLMRMLAEEKKLCGYLDMPLQHVSDKILKAMARAWGQKKTLALLDRLKERVPGLALRTTFIVGFPGETESDFQEILKTVEQGYFEHAGVFPYSLEQRSPSSRLSDAVPAAVVEERWQRLLEAQSRVMEKKALARVEKEVAILVEKGPDNEWSARAAHQAPEVDGQVLLDQYPSQPGFYRARIKGAQGIDLIGQLSSAAGAEPKARVRKGALLTSAA